MFVVTTGDMPHSEMEPWPLKSSLKPYSSEVFSPHPHALPAKPRTPSSRVFRPWRTHGNIANNQDRPCAVAQTLWRWPPRRCLITSTATGIGELAKLLDWSRAKTFSSGDGDGMYATYVGYDGEGAISAVVTDFVVLPYKTNRQHVGLRGQPKEESITQALGIAPRLSGRGTRVRMQIARMKT
jgi:hypothetical protein